MERDARQIKVDNQENKIVSLLGYEEAFKELTRAMTYTHKEEYFDYILRMNGAAGDE